MKSKKMSKRFFSFLLAGILTVPLQAYAAETITKEQEFTASADSEKEFARHTDFEEEIKEDGKTYILKDVSYEVLSKKYLDKKEKTIESGVVRDGETYEPAKTLTEDGITYTLVSTEPVEAETGEAYEQTVTAYEDYYYPVTAADVPGQKIVPAVNEKTGETQEVTCIFSGISGAGTVEIQNQMAITVEDYDAAYYEWNGNLIPRNDASPALDGYEAQLLADAGAQEGSRITGIAWSGEPYTVNGTVYRNATATVQQTVPVYRANYIGEIREEAEKGAVYRNTYEADDPEGEVELNVKAVALYERQMSNVPYILAGAAIAACAVLLAAVLLVLSKKRKKEQKEGK